jgi:hypothetical protein
MSPLSHLQATSLRPKIDCAHYEIRQHKDKRGFDLISDVLPFGRLWYGEPDAVTVRRIREVSQSIIPCCDSGLR